MYRFRPFRADPEAVCLADTEAVVDLWERCGLTRPWNDPYKDISRKLALADGLFLLAETTDQGRIVGSVMVGYEGHRGWINYLAVEPRLQGQGLGRQLMAEAETRLESLGCPKINLQIRADNDAVKRFYEALGYSEDKAVSYGKRLIPDN